MTDMTVSNQVFVCSGRVGGQWVNLLEVNRVNSTLHPQQLLIPSSFTKKQVCRLNLSSKAVGLAFSNRLISSRKLQKDNFLHPCLSAICSKISIATKELPRKNAREDLFRVMISVRGFSLSLLTNPYFAPKFQRNRRFSDGKVLCPCRSCGLIAWTFRWVQDFQNGENNRQKWSYTPNYQLKSIEMKCLFWTQQLQHAARATLSASTQVRHAVGFQHCGM